MKKQTYRTQVMEVLKIGKTTDTLNLNDDQPELLFGPEVDGKL